MRILLLIQMGRNIFMHGEEILFDGAFFKESSGAQG